MFKLKKNNESGLTLVELLATIVLSSIIFIFAYSILSNSLELQKKISIENTVRDEADIIMSNLIKTFYSLKESEVKKIDITPDGSKTLVYTSKNIDACSRPLSEEYKKNCLITGFETLTKNSKQYKVLYIQSNEYLLSNENISIYNDSNITISESKNSKVSYKITLSLKYDNKKFSKIYYFNNEIQSIQDIE